MDPCIVQRVELEIGGSTRLLRCDFGALWRIERESGKPWRTILQRIQQALSAQRNPKASDVRLVLFALLAAHDRTLTLKQVGAWGSFHNIPEVFRAIFDAIDAAMPLPDKWASKEPVAPEEPELTNWPELWGLARRRHHIRTERRFWQLTYREWAGFNEAFEQDQDLIEWRNGVHIAFSANRRRDPMKCPVAFEPEDFMRRGKRLKRMRPLRPKQTYEEQKAILLWAARRYDAYADQQKKLAAESKEKEEKRAKRSNDRQHRR